jgi:hypothetical protein
MVMDGCLIMSDSGYTRPRARDHDADSGLIIINFRFTGTKRRERRTKDTPNFCRDVIDSGVNFTSWMNSNYIHTVVSGPLIKE